jgi:hypothetical protein
MTPIEHSNDITQRFINQRKEEIQTINNLREAIYQLEAIVEDRERSLDNVCNAVLFWARTQGNHGGNNPYFYKFVQEAQKEKENSIKNEMDPIRF